MKNMTGRMFILLILVLLFLIPKIATAQDSVCKGLPWQKEQECYCQQQNPSLARTYVFREYPPREKPKTGAAGEKKRWYDLWGRLFPSKSPEGKYAANDVRLFRETFGRPIPLGESKRSYEIRMNAKKQLEDSQLQGDQKWQEWLKQNPNASIEEKSKAESRFHFQGLGATKSDKFDWRDQGLNVGEVKDQLKCNSCWAFASVDAAQASRRLAAMRAGKTGFSEKNPPNVRQLMSCMMPPGSDYCVIGDKSWHGEAFSYMIDEGLPLGGADKYGDQKFDWECDPVTRVKALTWDFVLKEPKQVPKTSDEIQAMKEALIVYGPMVTTMNADRCFSMYGSNIFNEQENEEDPNKIVLHMVLIVGWDDTKDGGAWLIKNSYGTNWGDKGFGWIKYGSNNIGRFSAFVVADPKEEERIAKELNQDK